MWLVFISVCVQNFKTECRKDRSKILNTPTEAHTNATTEPGKKIMMVRYKRM